MTDKSTRLNRILKILACLVAVVSIVILAQAVAAILESRFGTSPATAPPMDQALEPLSETSDDPESHRSTDATAFVPPIEVEVGDNLQDLIDRHGVGTSFVLASGVHREISVIPKDEQTFTGQEGTILSGARVLRSADFTMENGAWWIGGQSQQGLIHGDTLEGFDRDQHPEELFVNSDRRLRHVASRTELDESSWFFDYETDRIWLGTDPVAFARIETSVSPFAFGGTGVRHVTLRNLVVEKYASPYQYGAIGGDPSSRFTYDWHVVDVIARYNHGAGIIMGPGMMVESSRFHHNGQLGMAGNGIHRIESGGTGYTAPTTVRLTEIDHNLQLGFNWSHEGGGTKFTFMNGMIFEKNWVHDNRGPGVWWDIRNRNVLIQDNLIEDNDVMGIFYEISYGEAIIKHNIVRRNGLEDNRGGIEISLSSGVTVSDNVIVDNGAGIVVSHNEERRQSDSEPENPLSTERIHISGNTIETQDRHGTLVYGGAEDVFQEISYIGNQYCITEGESSFRWDGSEMSFAQWQSIHPEDLLGSECPAGPRTYSGFGSVLDTTVSSGPSSE